jgi:carboxylesterase type B
VLATDLLFDCALRNITAGQGTGATMFVYQFTHKASFDCWGPDYAYCVGRVCHGMEVTAGL